MQAAMPPRFADPDATSSERTYAVLMHLSLLAAHVLVPILPLAIMWIIKRKESPFIDDHGREAMNFQISLLIYFVAGTLLTVVGIGVLIMLATWALGIVGMILAAVAANRGEFYRYPATLRLID